MDSEVVENSANAAKALAEMANNLPDSGGIISWFTGDSSLSVFGEELVAFGPLLASYADSVSGLDSEVVKNSSDAALALAGMAESLPNQGGMLSWFVGDNTLSAFAKELAEFGPLLSNYADSISGINADVVTRSANAALALAELANNLPNNGGVASWFAGDNDISKFGEKLSSFGVSFSSYYSSVSTVNTSKLSSVTAELEKLVNVTTGISSVDTSAMSNFSQSLTKLGNSGIDSFINAFDGSHSKVIKSITDLINACISGINNQYKLFYNAGVNMMKGFATGIQSTSVEVTNTATGVVSTAVNAIKSVLDINSPSKVTNEIGKNTGEGFVNGLNETADDSEEAGENLGTSAYSGLLEGIEWGSEKTNAAMKAADTEAVNEKSDYWNRLIAIVENGSIEETALNNQNVSDQKAVNEETASLHTASIEEENKYWDELLAAKKNGEEQEKYQSMSMSEFRQDILSQTIEILKEYTDALQSNTDSLMNNSGIFSEVSEQEAVSADTLTKNLEDQIEQLEEYGTVMASLNSRIADGGLKDAINQMGVDSLAELQALNGMTDEELNNYVGLYDQKYAMCQQVAAQQLTGLQTETETKLSQLYGGAEVNLQQFAQSFDGTFESIRGYVGESITIGSQLATGVAEGITAGTEQSKQAAVQMITDTEEAAKQAADINSPSGVFRDNVGKNITAGIAEGIVADEAKSEIQAAVEEINQFTLESFTESSDTFVEAGVGIIESYKEGISNSTGELTAQCEESMTAALTQMQTVITNSQPTFQAEAANIITSFISGVQSKSSETIATITELTSNMLETIQSRYGEFNSVGVNCMTKFITGIKSKQSEAKSTITTIVTNMLTAIQNKYSQFNSTGTGCMEQFISGIQSKESEAVSTCEKIVSSCISALEDEYDGFYDVGVNLAEGFKEGILSKAREISRAAAEIAREAMEAVEDELDEHSPSKEMMKRGQYFSEGFAVGIEDEASSVTGVAKDMADSALSTVSDAIRTIAYIFDNGVDTEPTIRPVLDLSNVESGMGVLNTLFARNQVMAISNGMDEMSHRSEIQNDEPGHSNGNTYQFTQNNYSPKALSRVEIYRQTKNQFSAMERMVEA